MAIILIKLSVCFFGSPISVFCQTNITKSACESIIQMVKYPFHFLFLHFIDPHIWEI